MGDTIPPDFDDCMICGDDCAVEDGFCEACWDELDPTPFERHSYVGE